MFKKIKQFRLFIVALLIAFIASCSSVDRGPSGGFDEPREIEPMVAFWTNIYSVWDTDQVAFHDDRYLDVVYEVVYITQGDRRTWDLESNKIKQNLRAIEHQQRYGGRLTAEQAKMAKMLKKAGGNQAIIGAADRVRGQRGLKSRFREGILRSQAYLPYFRKVLRAKGMPEDLAFLPHVESSFQNNARSKVGASGMWQFMPGTARDYMMMRNNIIDSRFDPYIAAQGAAALLETNYRATGSWAMALTAYNSGLGHMRRAKERYGTDIGKIVWNYQEGAFKFASRNFYAEFLAARKIASNPRKYFPGIRFNDNMASRIEGIRLRTPMRLTELAATTGLSKGVLIELNPAWLENIYTDRALIPSNYDIWLPKGTTRRMGNRSFFTPSPIQP